MEAIFCPVFRIFIQDPHGTLPNLHLIGRNEVAIGRKKKFQDIMLLPPLQLPKIVNIQTRCTNLDVETAKRKKIKFSPFPIETGGLTKKDLYFLLNEFVLLPDHLCNAGFPEVYQKEVRIYKPPFFDRCGFIYYDDSPKKMINENSSFGHSDQTTKVNPLIPKEAEYKRRCIRCTKEFLTTSKRYLTFERCSYHWGKVESNYESISIYTCCKRPPGSIGCCTGRLHVWNGLEPGLNTSLKGFVKTQRTTQKVQKLNYSIFALDCEMCFTVQGLELCKVTIVGVDGKIVYNYFVAPETEVIDYNTRFSGITEQCVRGKDLKTLTEVQSDLLGLINDQTILIGHGLDNDLRALKLIHRRVIDTSLVFLHERGYPFRYSLKHLVSLYLGKDIQTSEMGHDSLEDARSCMELMLWAIRSKCLSEIRRKYFVHSL